MLENRLLVIMMNGIHHKASAKHGLLDSVREGHQFRVKNDRRAGRHRPGARGALHSDQSPAGPGGGHSFRRRPHRRPGGATDHPRLRT